MDNGKRICTASIDSGLQGMRAWALNWAPFHSEGVQLATGLNWISV